jgi:hypothetical protein
MLINFISFGITDPTERLNPLQPALQHNLVLDAGPAASTGKTFFPSTLLSVLLHMCLR